MKVMEIMKLEIITVENIDKFDKKRKKIPIKRWKEKDRSKHYRKMIRKKINIFKDNKSVIWRNKRVENCD